MAQNDPTRTKLLDAGRVLFAKQGFSGTTVKDIADTAGVNVSLVSYHFDGKAGLYSAILEEFADDRFGMAKRVLKPAATFEELVMRIEMYVAEIIGTHLDQPENVCLLHREIEQGLSKEAEVIFRKTFLKSTEYLLDIFKHAQKLKYLRTDITPLSMVMILMGAVMHVAQKDGISEKFFGVTIKDEMFRKQIVHDIVSVCMDGMKAKEK